MEDQKLLRLVAKVMAVFAIAFILALAISSEFKNSLISEKRFLLHKHSEYLTIQHIECENSKIELFHTKSGKTDTLKVDVKDLCKNWTIGDSVLNTINVYKSINYKLSEGQDSLINERFINEIDLNELNKNLTIKNEK